jgi:hypothetical protein
MLKNFWAGLLVVCAIVLSGPYLWQYFLFSEDTIKTVIDACGSDANKIYALDITKWAIENNTDAFNPYAKARDQFIADCVKRDGRWCGAEAGASDIWPCPWAECFLPVDSIGRWLWNRRNKEKTKWKCQ